MDRPKHTSGPLDVWHRHGTEDQTSIESRHHGPVAIIVSRNAVADARLMARSPELYALAQRVAVLNPRAFEGLEGMFITDLQAEAERLITEIDG